MTRQEFNTKVNATKKELLKGDAHDMFLALKTQNLYRSYGIEGKSFDTILTEIAEAKVLGVDLIEDININEWIKSM